MLNVLGAGGMGTVYEAFDPKLERKVALKLLHEDTEAAAEGREQLLKEARALARLAHPNVVPVYDVGEVDGRVYIALELVRGHSLRAWLATRPSHSEALRVLRLAGRGLAAAHAEGLVHRDIKPENILLGDDGRPRVTDFGLAHLSGATSPGRGHPRESILTRGVGGTPAYMSPEQLVQRTADAQSDQFSYCVTVYEAVFGRRPFAGGTVEERCNSLSTPLAFPRAVVPGVRIRRALRRGLSVDPEARFASMDALLAELKAPRWGLRAAVGAAVILVALAAWEGTRLARSSCPAEAELLLGPWPDGTGARLETAFGAGRAAVSATGKRGLALLDQRVHQWASQSQTTCGVASRRGASPLEVARLACLKRRGEQLQVLVDVLSKADPLVVAKSEDLITSFTADVTCREGLTRLTPDDVPPEKADLARRLRAQLLRAWALELLERGTEGLAVARQVADEARSAGLNGFEAEALFRCASVEYYLGDPVASLKDYRRSLHGALAAGVDDRALWAAVKVTRRLAERAGALDEAREMLQLGETLLLRLGGDPKLELDLIDARAAVLAAENRLTELGALRQRALELSRTVYGERSTQVAYALADVSSALHRAGRLAESVDFDLQATQLLAAVVGADDPKLVPRYRSLGEGEYELGRGQEALGHLEQSLALGLRVLEPNDALLADSMYAASWLLEGKDEVRALDLSQKAVAIYERSTDATEVALPLLARARSLAALGKGNDSLRDCERAQSLLASTADPARILKQRVFICRGRAFEALGKAAGAAEAWGAARAIAPPSVSVIIRGTIAFHLARALRAIHAPAEQVRGLGQEAIAEFSTFPGLAARKTEVETFLDDKQAHTGVRREN